MTRVAIWSDTPDTGIKALSFCEDFQASHPELAGVTFELLTQLAAVKEADALILASTLQAEQAAAKLRNSGMYSVLANFVMSHRPVLCLDSAFLALNTRVADMEAAGATPKNQRTAHARTEGDFWFPEEPESAQEVGKDHSVSEELLEEWPGVVSSEIDVHFSVMGDNYESALSQAVTSFDFDVTHPAMKAPEHIWDDNKNRIIAVFNNDLAGAEIPRGADLTFLPQLSQWLRDKLATNLKSKHDL